MQFSSETERIEIINGMLLGMLMGSLFAINTHSICLIIIGSALVVLISAICTDTLSSRLKLPLLGLPYSIVAFMLLPLATTICLPRASSHLPGLFQSIDAILPLGAMYFNGTGSGGTLILLAFCLSSRYLALLAIASSLLSSAFLSAVGVPAESMISLVCRMNSVLAGCVIGGLFAVPGKRSIAVAMAAAVLASALALAFNQILSFVGLPVLALPFVVVTYICMLVFNAQRGPAWAYFWLPVPALPEASLEQIQIATIRGVDYRSIALKAPFQGQWQIYQGFGGAHTHRGNWHYALDFFQTSDSQSFAGDGGQLGDYYCFGKPVFSPAYGTVIDAISDLPDNEPGDVDTINNWGNHILIRLDCGGYVILAHLQEQSIKVKIGTRVAPGDRLASVGNSGRSPQPHLHMHVQESAYLGAKTIPFHMSGIITHNPGENTYALRVCPRENDLISVPNHNQPLKRALRLVVGNTFVFRVTDEFGEQSLRKLHVSLDLNGQFWLTSDGDARIAFSSSDELLAFYNRQGGKDMLLDAIVLAMGSTPLVEGDLTWHDMAQNRVLPRDWIARLSHAIFYPFSPSAQSKYIRNWDSFQKLWTQQGEHKIGNWTCHTSAQLCEDRGLREFQLQIDDRVILNASLLELGIREDNGIPEWSSPLTADATTLRSGRDARVPGVNHGEQASCISST
uniref:Metalloendopeptidase n=1 Tax=uncultured bacterium BLR16 TaxID=506516 RepID=C7S7A2_9BACT|nr:metalloendopeptidase [uncultured bacterium BLR16]